MKKITISLLIFFIGIYCYAQKNNKLKKNITKVSVYDRVNNIVYTHDYIMNYNCTKMKPIKIMQGFILSDSTEKKIIKRKSINK